MSNAIELTTSTFDDTVKEGKVLVDFWASWCGPCRIQMPIVEKLAGDLPNVTFGKVNVDEQPELAARYGIQSIPTLLVFNQGHLEHSLVGVHTEVQLRKVLA